MPRIFHFVAKIQQKGAFCSNKMLLNRPQTFVLPDNPDISH